jgi:hypothetical protein
MNRGLQAVTDFSKKHYYLLTALLMFLSFPSYDFWFLKGFAFFAWFSLAPLFLFVRGRSMKQVFAYSFLTGLAGNLLTYNWIGNFGAVVEGDTPSCSPFSFRRSQDFRYAHTHRRVPLAPLRAAARRHISGGLDLRRLDTVAREPRVPLDLLGLLAVSVHRARADGLRHRRHGRFVPCRVRQLPRIRPSFNHEG